MSRREAGRRSSLAKLGAVSLAAALALFAVYYVIVNFLGRQGAYRIGVHFPTVAGLANGAQVFLSGVDVGTVDEVNLQPDNTVDVILSIRPQIEIPAGSTFAISPTLTSGPNLLVYPPPHVRENLSHRVLPVTDQPTGGSRASLEDLLAQGQDVTKRFPVMLAMLRAHQRPLLESLRSTHVNGLALRAQMGGSEGNLRRDLVAITQRTRYYALNTMTTVNASRARNRNTVDSLALSLHAMASDLNRSMDALQTISADPSLRSNVRTATANVRRTADTMSQLDAELGSVAANSQTRAELRDAGAQLKAAVQKAASLLRSLQE